MFFLTLSGQDQCNLTFRFAFINQPESVGFASFWHSEDLDILFDPGRGRIFVVEVSSLERFDAYGIMFFSDAVRSSFFPKPDSVRRTCQVKKQVYGFSVTQGLCVSNNFDAVRSSFVGR